MRKYVFVPHEIRLLPRHGVDYGKVDPNSIVLPEGGIADAQEAEDLAPNIFKPSGRVQLIMFGGAYFVASTGARAYQDTLAILDARTNGEKVPAKIYKIDVADPDLYLQYTYGDILSREAFSLELDMSSPTDVVESVTKDVLTGERFVEAVIEETSDVYATLRDYALMASSRMKKVPLLVGHTGVGKSAIVKKLEGEIGTDGYGFRVHTLKAGFMDKVDLLGYVQVNKDPELGMVAQDSPMYELMISTDAFVENVRELLKKVDKETLTYTDGVKHTLTKKEYEQLQYFARTPVLFFDEINRADPFIISTLMTLFSERTLNDYKFSHAVMITAANWAIDITNDELEALYKVTLIEDPAQIDRFFMIKVSHEDPSVIESTISYLSDKYSNLPDVSVFLRDLNTRGFFYNPELALSDSETYVKTKFGSGLHKFPTFRGWDNVLQYLAAKYAGKTEVYMDFIAGLVGNDAADAAKDYITGTLGLKVTSSDETGEDVYDVVLKESFNSGLPALMLGRFGLAKSSKVKAVADSHNAILYRVDLQAMDRTTLRGMPHKMDLADVAFGGSVIGNLVKARLDEQNKPLYTTKFVPFDFARVVAQARQENRDLIVFFDEMNRAEPVEQSAVFDAISEGKILGVDVSDLQRRGKIKIVAAGNVGDEYDSQDFDAAAVARFAVVAKEGIGEKDYESFLKWASGNFHPYVVDWLTDNKKSFIELINSDVEIDSGLISDTFSFRTLEVVNAAIQSYVGTYAVSAFTEDISTQMALAIAASNKWRGNIEPPSGGLRYKVVDGPEAGTKKTYATPLAAVQDVEAGYLPTEEFVLDITAIDSKRLEWVMNFIKESFSSKIWLQLEPQIRELVSRIFKDAYESDESVSEAMGRSSESLKDHIPTSLLTYYDKIVSDVEQGKGIDPEVLYQAAFEKFISAGNPEDAFDDNMMLESMKIVLEEISELGNADVDGAIEAISKTLELERNPTSSFNELVVITPKNINQQVAYLSALSSIARPGMSGIIANFEGVADAIFTIDKDTLKIKVDHHNSGMFKLIINGSVFGVAYSTYSSVGDSILGFEVDVNKKEVKLKVNSALSSVDNFGAITITLRGFKVEQQDLKSLSEYGEKLTEAFESGFFGVDFSSTLLTLMPKPDVDETTLVDEDDYAAGVPALASNVAVMLDSFFRKMFT